MLSVRLAPASLAAWAEAHPLPATEIPPIAGEALNTMYVVRPYSYIVLAVALKKAKF